MKYEKRYFIRGMILNNFPLFDRGGVGEWLPCTALMIYVHIIKDYT